MDNPLPGIKVRSVTVFTNPGWPLDLARLDAAGAFAAAARQSLAEAGYEVQTLRLATVPFPQLLGAMHSRQADRRAGLLDLALSIETAAQERGFEYISLGPAQPNRLEDYEFIPDVIAATRSVFVSAAMTGGRSGVSLAAVRACGRIIQACAGITPDGFANLRFAALANVKPGSPFFPAAYHRGDRPAFALATEAGGMAAQIFRQAGSLAEARRGLVEAIETHAQRLAGATRRLEQTHTIANGGIDFSPAPHPAPDHSLGAALEHLGLPALGLHGSLAAAAFLADALDRANFQRSGFSGLMLPVLEDATLAGRAAQGSLTVRDLLLYSAVCGTGLDTIPLPGDTGAQELAAILLDVAALAKRLNKPLTARLMPIPGKAAGDPTNFDFSFFVNSRVMAVEAAPLHGLLAGSESFVLHKRRRG